MSLGELLHLSRENEKLEEEVSILHEALLNIRSITEPLQPNSGHMYLADINQIHHIVEATLKVYAEEEK